jgi:hypothetical protein
MSESENDSDVTPSPSPVRPNRGGRGVGRGRGRVRGRGRNDQYHSTETNREVATAFKVKRTKVGTKRTYSSKITKFKEWLVEKHPDGLDDDMEVIIPVADNIFKDFLGHLFTPAHERAKCISPEDIPPGEADPYSATTIKGYRSAIVDLYTSQSLTVDPRLNVELNEMMTGYEKHINELRQRSLMKLEEGKEELTFSGYQLLCRKFSKWIPGASTVGGHYITGIFM